MSTRASPERCRGAATASAARMLAAGALWLATVASAQGQVQTLDPQAERARIERDRQAVQARHDAALRDCAGTLALTACQERAHAQRRAAVEALDAERAALDDAQRRARVKTQRAATEQRAREHEAALAARAAASRTAAPAAANAASVPATRPPKPAGAAHEAPPDREGREAQARARWQARNERARAHREAVERRNAEDVARRTPAAGLPLPPASRPASGPRR